MKYLYIYKNKSSYYLHPRIFKLYLIYKNPSFIYYSVLEEWVFYYEHYVMHYNNINKIDNFPIVYIKPAQDHSVNTLEKRYEIITELLIRLEEININKKIIINNVQENSYKDLINKGNAIVRLVNSMMLDRNIKLKIKSRISVNIYTRLNEIIQKLYD